MGKATLLRLSLLLAFLLSACGTATPPPVANTAAPAKTSAPASPTRLPAASRLQALEPKLKGLTLTVWHPWFGTDARLFETMVEEFNNKNLWGFQVSAAGQTSYSVLYDNVTAALPTENRPDMVIALPEQARLWDVDGFVEDLSPYVNDPAYGWTPGRGPRYSAGFLAAGFRRGEARGDAVPALGTLPALEPHLGGGAGLPGAAVQPGRVQPPILRRERAQ